MKFRFPISIPALFLLLVFAACKDVEKQAAAETIQVPERIWEPYDDSAEVAATSDRENPRMRFQLIQSRVTDKNEVFKPLYAEAMSLGEARYRELLPLILEQPIPAVQEHVRNGDLTYEELTRFFLYRIYRYELDNSTTLNAIMALNPKALEEARLKDEVLRLLPEGQRHPVFGMPVLLKDNIDTKDMPTTAGAVALRGNETDDAFIVKQLRSSGAVILGKVNLSEWAYFFCNRCPTGYSAIGGQTLSPYGRRMLDPGSSSSGSGVAAAAGYAMGTVGTETSGSILSPSGRNSVVGLKPTTGILGRTGIVPISATLDTPGPIARTVTDAAILLDAMRGYDMDDPAAIQAPSLIDGLTLRPDSFQGRRLGVFEELLESDSLYRATTGRLEEAGAILVPITPPEVDVSDMYLLMKLDMKRDLAEYLRTQVRDTVSVLVRSVADIVSFNREDSLIRMPYGQADLMAILEETMPPSELPALRERLRSAGSRYFITPWKEYDLDVVLSVDSRHARLAAAANYPALCVPMGYRADGQPTGLTFIGKPYWEKRLLEMGLGFEKLISARQWPDEYRD